jgi:large repetitive protein
MKRLLATGLTIFSIATAASAAVTGTVVDDDGAPLAGAVVRAFAFETPHAATLRLLGGKIDREPLARVETANSGAFKVETGGAAAVTIAVSAPGRQLLEVEAADGDDLGALMIATAKTKKLRVTADGKPVANAIVLAGSVFAAKSGADGTVDVPAIVGTPSRITVLHPDFAPFAAGTPQSGQIDLTRGTDVRGRVVAADGKTPVPHARVWIGSYSTAESGDDGAFTVAHVAPRWAALRVTAGSAAGFAANNGAQAYTVAVRPSASIAGTLVDAKSGAAVGGMRLQLMAVGDQADAAITDAKGAFAFESVPPSEYIISGTHPAYQLETRTPFSVAAGEHSTRALKAVPQARLRGVVIDEEKKPVGGVIVTRGQSGAIEGVTRFGVTNARGEFALRVQGVQREFELQAIKAGYATGAARAKVVPGETPASVTITLPRGIPLTVQVVDREKKPVAEANVGLMHWMDDPYGFRVPISRCTSGPCVTGADGKLEFRIVPGKYDVNVTGETLAAKNIPGQTIDAKTSPLTVIVDRGVEVSGRVAYEDGKPVADAGVTLLSSGFPPQSATTDASGAFSFHNAASGPATLQASLSRSSRLSSSKKEIKAPATNVVITMPRGGTISGRVLDDATHAPVTDFQVSSMHAGMTGSPLAVQSSDGAFTLTGIAPGSTDILVTARGYAAGGSHGIEVEEGKAAPDVEIHLERGATLKGRVASSDGQPLEGVTIMVEDPSRRMRSGPLGGDATDANGAYVIDSVTPGSRMVMFNKSGYVAQRKTIDAASGKETTLDVTLERGRELHGKVIDESGQPVAQADIRGEGDTMIPPTRTESDGTFTLAGLRDVHLRVIARKSGYVEARVEDVDPAGPAVTLTLTRGGTITGHVSGATEAEMAALVVNAAGQGAVSNGRVDASGNFTLQGIPDGRFMVQASVMGQQMRHTVRKAVEVVNGSAAPVELSFSEGYTMRGHITVHGQPLAGAMINFNAADATVGIGSSARSDTDGSYTATGLSNAEYNVLVMSPTADAIFNDKTTVSGNGVYDVDARASAVHGHVVDAKSGAPLPDAQVMFMPVEMTRPYTTPRPSTTDFAGRFSSDYVPERKWRLRVQREKYQTLFLDVEVGPGTPEVEARLEPASSVTVRIVDSRDGTPIAGANVNVVDAGGKAVFGGQSHEDGTIQIWVGEGHYTVSASAPRFAPARAGTDVPGPGLQIALDRAGRIVVTSPSPARVRLTGGTLVAPLTSMAGRFENVRPGSYLIELLSNDNKTLDRRQIVVVESQTTSVAF